MVTHEQRRALPNWPGDCLGFEHFLLRMAAGINWFISQRVLCYLARERNRLSQTKNQNRETSSESAIQDRLAEDSFML